MIFCISAYCRIVSYYVLSRQHITSNLPHFLVPMVIEAGTVFALEPIRHHVVCPCVRLPMCPRVLVRPRAYTLSADDAAKSMHEIVDVCEVRGGRGSEGELWNEVDSLEEGKPDKGERSAPCLRDGAAEIGSSSAGRATHCSVPKGRKISYCYASLSCHGKLRPRVVELVQTIYNKSML